MRSRKIKEFQFAGWLRKRLYREKNRILREAYARDRDVESIVIDLDLAIRPPSRFDAFALFHAPSPLAIIALKDGREFTARLGIAPNRTVSLRAFA